MTRAPRRSVLSCAGRAALIPAAAIAVHQLRFELAFGGRAAPVLARTGHSYLHSLVPWIVLLIGLSLGAGVWTLGRALSGRRSRSTATLSFLTLWLVCALCLVAIYCTQEFLEGLLATGHPLGLAGIFGFGGWWAVPAAVGVGLVLATLFHTVTQVLDELSQQRGRPMPSPPRRPARIDPPGAARVFRSATLARGWSDRGPPALAAPALHP